MKVIKDNDDIKATDRALSFLPGVEFLSSDMTLDFSSGGIAPGALKMVSRAVRSAGSWDGPATCPVCMKVLSNKYNLRTHLEDKHSPVQHAFPCPICKHVYKTKNSLHNHFSMRHRGLKMPQVSP